MNNYIVTFEYRVMVTAFAILAMFETLLSLNLSRMSMFLILPDSLNPGIQSMEANMTTETIKALMTTLQVTYTQPLVRFSN